MTAAILIWSLLATPGTMTVVPPSAADLDMRPFLELVKEPALETLPATARVFRFMWLPPFRSQRTICVRVQEGAAGPELEAKAVTSKGETDVHVKRRLTTQEWDTLASAREHGFWKYQPEAFPQRMFDGDYWVVEGQSAGERLRVVQHVPKEGAFRSLGYMMFRLSGISLRPTENSLRER